MGTTRTQMNTLINSRLGTMVDKVTAAEHREVETAMLEYVSNQILAVGESAAFNANTTGIIVPLGVTLPDTSYIIVGNLVSLGFWNADNDVVWDITNKTNSSFTLNVYEWFGGDQSVALSWIAISTPGENHPANI